MPKHAIRCSMKPLAHAIGLALMVTALPVAATPTYVITDMNTLGGASSSGNAINNAGQVAGESSLPTNDTHAFLWQNGAMQNLGTLGGASSNAKAINDGGQVVGQASTAAGATQAFSWQNGAMTNIGPAIANGSVASGLNNAGQIVGSVAIGGTAPINRAAFWPNSASNPVFLQNVTSTANGINNASLAVGEADTGNGIIQAYAIGSNGVPVPLGVLPNGTTSHALAVNDQGQAVGYADTPADTGTVNHAVLWQQNLVIQDIGTLGGANSNANAINGNSQVVGFADTPASGPHAFFWHNGVMIDLNVIAADNPQNLTLAVANGINVFGQITGSATTVSGQTHAFLATPAGTLNWTNGSGAWNNPANWELGFVPGPLLETVIAPLTGDVTVSGPTAATTVNSLSVGGGGGSATLTLNPGAPLTVNTDINLLQGGTLALGGSNLLGNATVLVVNGGTLDIQSNNNTLSVVQLQAGAIVGTTGTLTSASDFGLQAGSVSAKLGGAVGLAKTTPGTVILSGANTYTGPTTVSEGVLSLAGGAAIADTGEVNVGSTGTLNLLNNETIGSLSGAAGSLVTLNANMLNTGDASNALFAGVINGTGGLVKQGAGTLTLTGANTYTGGTTVSAGTLQGNATSLQGNILNNAAVVFDQATAGTYAGAMSGSGALTKKGVGLLILTGGNIYSGGTTVSAGTLQGNADNLQGNIVNNAAVVFDQATAGTYAGSLSGTGSLTKQGAGSLTLTGANTFGGSATVAAGTLVNQGALNNQANLNSQPGGTINNASGGILANIGMIANQGTIDNVGILNNQGILTNQTGGILNLAVGGQMLNAGTFTNQGTVNLQGAWADSGNSTASLNNQGTFNISGSGTHVINGNVLNQGTFNVQMASVSFTGNFDNQGAYISSQFNNGHLSIGYKTGWQPPSTSQFNNLSVGSNGYISGGPQDNFIVTGNFANASTQNTQWNTANSNLTFTSATPGQPASHQMQLAGQDVGAKAVGAVNNFAWGSVTLSNGDRLTLADGNATPGAALYARQVNLPGGMGELGNISSGYNVYFDPTLPANQPLLGGGRFGSGGGLLLPWSFVPFTTGTLNDIALTPNEKDFASALNEACTAPRGSLTARCVELQGLGVPQQKQAIASLTPDQVPAQTSMPVQFGATRMDAPLARLATLRAGGGTPFALNINGLSIPVNRKLANLLGPDAKGGAAGADTELFRDSPLGIFIQTRFNFGDMDTNTWSRGFNSQTRNVTVGADYRFTDQLVAGVAFNYTNVSTNYVQSSGRMDSDTYMGAVYGSYYLPHDFYVDWVANYGGNNYAFRRQFQYTGFAGQSNSSPGGNQYSFAVSGGKEFNWQEWLFNPYLRLEYLNLHIDAYDESGGGGFAIATGGQTNHSFVTDLGLQISHAVSLPWGVVTPSLRVEWEHQYLNDNRAVNMRLSDASAGLGYFSVQTGNPDRDYLNLGGSFSAALPNGGGAFIRYETRLSQTYISEHIVEGGVRLTF